MYKQHLVRNGDDTHHFSTLSMQSLLISYGIIELAFTLFIFYKQNGHQKSKAGTG